ncbi:MAG: hypothetical protein F4X81_10090 [Gammaproteobacteria bacterium]|nr:hypothetical protein [Gammaproteobacteria bacterium]MYE51802.1 hypothetical protein [Gammaproteobacteria bacterium]MYF49220.1 hypothetical protein [Gammaproteobacteria bacterium]
MNYAKPCPHGPVETVTDRLAFVRGSMRMNALLRISRNMAILRDEDGLTLVNPIRLTASGEEALARLGPVRRILRLGAMHGIDDPYYKARFGAELWGEARGTIYPNPPVDRDIAGEFPLPEATLFRFERTQQPEAALLVPGTPSVLLTCDAIQHYGDYTYNNRMARMAMPFIGFPKTTVVGPIWLKRMTPPGASLQSEFERLLELDFDALLSAHGTFLNHDAKASVRRAVARAFEN